MESRVENANLWNLRKKSGNGINSFEIGRIVQGCQINAFFQCTDYVVIYTYTSTKLFTRMNHPMPDSIHFVYSFQATILGVNQDSKNIFDSFLVIEYLSFHLEFQSIVALVFYRSSLEPYLIYQAFGVHFGRRHIEQLIFNGRTSAIQNNYFHKYNSLRIKK